MPPRKADTHKFDYGPVLVIAGAANYYWAPHASAYSFLKSGGDYVYLACPASLTKSIARRGKEIVFQPQAETTSGSIAYSSKQALLKLAQKMKMVVLGPGLSLDEETQQLARELAAEITVPLLIDGDGITAMAKQPQILTKRRAPTILTPHMGEMSRLTGKRTGDIEKERIDVLQETASRLNSIIVLKGPRSLVGYPDGRVKINVSGATGGQAGMATHPRDGPRDVHDDPRVHVSRGRAQRARCGRVPGDQGRTRLRGTRCYGEPLPATALISASRTCEELATGDSVGSSSRRASGS